MRRPQCKPVTNRYLWRRWKRTRAGLRKC